MVVSLLEDHIEREHTLKYKGYLCDCNEAFLELDRHLFRRHREKVHNVCRREDLEEYLINIPQGYYSMVICELCNHAGFTQSQIDRHAKETHRSVNTSSSQAEFDELPTCPYNDCNVRTKHLGVHIEDVHTLKNAGYKCLSIGCSFICSSVHTDLLRNHWAGQHGGQYIDDIQIEASQVHIPEGYYMLVKCDVCGVFDFGTERIAQHKRKVHNMNRSNEIPPENKTSLTHRKVNVDSLTETLKVLSKTVDQQLTQLKKRSAPSLSESQAPKINKQAGEQKKDYDAFLDSIIKDEGNEQSVPGHIQHASDFWSTGRESNRGEGQDNPEAFWGAGSEASTSEQGDTG